MIIIGSEEWTPDAAEDLARASLGPLSEKHWRAIAACREIFASGDCVPSLERVAGTANIPIPELARLFSGRAAELIAEIAGMPSPLPPQSKMDPMDTGSQDERKIE